MNNELGADFGIPIFELPVFFTFDQIDTDIAITRRELAFRKNLHFTYFNVLNRLGRLTCISAKDNKRCVGVFV